MPSEINSRASLPVVQDRTEAPWSCRPKATEGSGPERSEGAEGRSAKRASPSIFNTSAKSVTRSGGVSDVEVALSRDRERVYSELEHHNRHTERLEKLGGCKQRSLALAREAPEHARKRANEQIGCGAFLHFRMALEGPHKGERRLFSGIHCHQLTCEICQIRKAARVLQAYTPKVLQAWAENRPKGCRLLFVTLTQRNGSDLTENLQVLSDRRKLLRDRIRQNRKRNAGPFRNLVGGVGHIETKRGQDGEWHPHLHELWLNNGRANFKLMREAWAEITGMSDVQVKIKHLNVQHALDSGSVMGDVDIEAQLAGDLAEVLKYPLKFEYGSPADMWHIADCLRGIKRLRPFGCLYGIKVNPELLDDPIDWDLFAFMDFYYRYAGEGRYKAAPAPRLSLKSQLLEDWNNQ